MHTEKKYDQKKFQIKLKTAFKIKEKYFFYR